MPTEGSPPWSTYCAGNPTDTARRSLPEAAAMDPEAIAKRAALIQQAVAQHQLKSRRC